MVHTFEALGGYFVVDTESGSVFEVDRLTHLLTRARMGEEVSLAGFDPSEIGEADSELTRLVQDGLLFTPADKKAADGGTATDANGTTADKKVANGVTSDRKTADADGATADKKTANADGGAVVKALCLNVCHACNLRCGYCFADEGTYGSQERPLMSVETAKKAVDFLIGASAGRRNLEIDFFGGEPLLNFGVIRETVEYAKARAAAAGKTFRFTVTTNGILLTREMSDYINQEFNNVVISIDGRKAVHNFMRGAANGADYYDLIVENTRYLVGLRERDGKDYFIRGTFTRRNTDFTRDIEALVDLGFRELSLEPVALPEEHPLALSDADIERSAEEYERLARLYWESLGTDREFRFFHFYIDLTGGPCRDKLSGGCGAGRQYLAVSPRGELYPCHQYDGRDGFALGNVNDSPVRLDAALRQGFAGCNVDERKECRECWAKYYCGGGCSANSEFLAENRLKPYETACKLLKKRTELAIALYGKSLDYENETNI